VHVVDSPVCRGGKAADEGTLLSFVGGDKEIVERLRPVLGAYSTDIVHTGGVGTGQVAKAANNMIMWSCLIADHEALALAKRALSYVKGADQAAIAVNGGDRAYSRFARNYVVQNIGSLGTTVSVTYVKGKRTGQSTTGDLSEAGLRAAIARLTQLSRSA